MIYNIKAIICENGYISVKRYYKDLERYENKKNILQNKKTKKNILQSKKNNKEIRYDSLSRTRETLINYICQNSKRFNTFITLTFKDVMSIEEGNKKFHNFITKHKKIDSNFTYIGVPEYQKRGSIHYHIFTSLKVNTDLIPFSPIDTYDLDGNIKHFDYTIIKYWSYGFSTIIDISKNNPNIDNNFNIALYMCKYLFKDRDNRLYNHNKILKSNNLDKPNIKYLHNFSLYKDCDDYLINKGYKPKYYTNNDFSEEDFFNEYNVLFEKLDIKINESDINDFINYLDIVNGDNELFIKK